MDHIDGQVRTCVMSVVAINDPRGLLAMASTCHGWLAHASKVMFDNSTLRLTDALFFDLPCDWVGQVRESIFDQMDEWEYDDDPARISKAAVTEFARYSTPPTHSKRSSSRTLAKKKCLAALQNHYRSCNACAFCSSYPRPTRLIENKLDFARSLFGNRFEYGNLRRSKGDSRVAVWVSASKQPIRPSSILMVSRKRVRMQVTSLMWLASRIVFPIGGILWARIGPLESLFPRGTRRDPNEALAIFWGVLPNKFALGRGNRSNSDAGSSNSGNSRSSSGNSSSNSSNDRNDTNTKNVNASANSSGSGDDNNSGNSNGGGSGDGDDDSNGDSNSVDGRCDFADNVVCKIDRDVSSGWPWRFYSSSNFSFFRASAIIHSADWLDKRRVVSYVSDRGASANWVYDFKSEERGHEVPNCFDDILRHVYPGSGNAFDTTGCDPLFYRLSVDFSRLSPLADDAQATDIVRRTIDVLAKYSCKKAFADSDSFGHRWDVTNDRNRNSGTKTENNDDDNNDNDDNNSNNNNGDHDTLLFCGGCDDKNPFDPLLKLLMSAHRTHFLVTYCGNYPIKSASSNLHVYVGILPSRASIRAPDVAWDTYKAVLLAKELYRVAEKVESCVGS